MTASAMYFIDDQIKQFHWKKLEDILFYSFPVLVSYIIVSNSTRIPLVRLQSVFDTFRYVQKST